MRLIPKRGIGDGVKPRHDMSDTYPDFAWQERELSVWLLSEPPTLCFLHCGCSDRSPSSLCVVLSFCYGAP
jgi:hypothetical protein